MYNSVTIFKGATLLDISLIMLGAGNSSRFELPVKKQWLRIGSDPLWLFATKNLSNFYTFKEIIVVSKECKYMSKFAPNYKFVDGGETRQDSLKNALELVNSEFVLVSDIARPCISSELFHKIIEAAAQADCVVPALKIADTAYLGENAIDREKVKLIQTPQLSRTALLKKALSSGEIYTDDSSAMRAIGASVWHILGDEMARKITFKEDLAKISALKAPENEVFVGSGFDVHEFEKGRQLVLCGEKIDYEFGLKAHSDGDVALHALTDAILGAAGLGDIGELFPDTDAKFKDISSIYLLQEAYKIVQSVGFVLTNADITIMAQKPKLSKLKSKMEANIAQALNLSRSRINVKATTTEGLGFVGRCEGIAVMASASLKFYNWTQI